MSSVGPDRFLLYRWADPALERRGFPVNSIYTETVLLPIIGPSATFCLRRLSAFASAQPDGTVVDTKTLARDLGLGEGLGSDSPIARTLGRLCRFHMAYWHGPGTEMYVRTAVPPVSERQLARLSPEIVRTHHWLVRQQENRTALTKPSTPPAVQPETLSSLRPEGVAR